MKIIAIDPGPVRSAYVKLDRHTLQIYDKGILENRAILKRADLGFGWKLQRNPYELALETFSGIWQKSGPDVVQTLIWIGRFYQGFRGRRKIMVPRMQVRINMCGGPRANDATIRRACIERLGEPGTKANPGFTHGVVKDMWQALGCGLTYIDLRESYK